MHPFISKGTIFIIMIDPSAFSLIIMIMYLYNLLTSNKHNTFFLRWFTVVSTVCDVGPTLNQHMASILLCWIECRPSYSLVVWQEYHATSIYCSAKIKGSICLFVNKADTAIWLCTTECTQEETVVSLG